MRTGRGVGMWFSCSCGDAMVGEKTLDKSNIPLDPPSKGDRSTVPELPIGPIADEAQLDDLLSEPSMALVDMMRRVTGDVIVLGVAGKMGVTLARMAKRASDAAGTSRRVFGVARFSSSGVREKLERYGVETIACDLLDQASLDGLPEAPNVVYMAGMKFGATQQEGLTWAMNCYLPGMVAQRYRRSRIVAFSTGNVYGMVPVLSGGSREGDPLRPEGDYAMSCVGRERILDHFSRTLDIPMAIIRLNYAVEMRYGVLADLARKVWTGQPVDVSMGYFNAIWQADANDHALRAFEHVHTPPEILNVTGPELLQVREVAADFAERMGKAVSFTGHEAPDALLNDASKALSLLGAPRVGAEQVQAWLADWVARGGASLDKPTHFEVRNGKY